MWFCRPPRRGSFPGWRGGGACWGRGPCGSSWAWHGVGCAGGSTSWQAAPAWGKGQQRGFKPEKYQGSHLHLLQFPHRRSCLDLGTLPSVAQSRLAPENIPTTTFSTFITTICRRWFHLGFLKTEQCPRSCWNQPIWIWETKGSLSKENCFIAIICLVNPCNFIVWVSSSFWFVEETLTGLGTSI